MQIIQHRQTFKTKDEQDRSHQMFTFNMKIYVKH